eukprot:m.103039 g.103039  ORF g.103039 m.103039 type:complete len:552 (+) comp14136_c0_seq1:76-1731(+)
MSQNIIHDLHVAASRLAEAEAGEFGTILNEIQALLATGGPDARAEAWALSIPHIFADCLLLPLEEQQVHLYATLVSMLVEFAQEPAPNSDFNEIEAARGLCMLIRRIRIGSEAAPDHAIWAADLRHVCLCLRTVLTVQPTQLESCFESFLGLLDTDDDWAGACVLDTADAIVSYHASTLLTRAEVADDLVGCVSTRLATTADAAVADSCARILTTLMPAARILERSLSLREDLAQALPRWPHSAAVTALARRLLLTAPYAGVREAAATTIQRHWRGHSARSKLAAQRDERARHAAQVARLDSLEKEKKAARALMAALHNTTTAAAARAARIAAMTPAQYAAFRAVERTEAARRLQCTWRGIVARRRAARLAAQRTRIRAVVLIQRMFRGYRTRKALRTAPPPPSARQAATIDPRLRAELQREITARRNKWIEEHRVPRDWSAVRADCEKGEALFNQLLRPPPASYTSASHSARMPNTEHVLESIRDLSAAIRSAPPLAAITPNAAILHTRAGPGEQRAGREAHRSHTSNPTEPLWVTLGRELDAVKYLSGN